MRDTKTAEERRFYSSARWQRFRDWYIKANPLCVDCLREGRTEVGTTVDHIIPRRQAPDLELAEENMQTLCDTHHAKKRQQERHGKAYVQGCDLNGLPLDPNHHWKR